MQDLYKAIDSLRKINEAEDDSLNEDISIGDHVKVKGQDIEGKVIADNGNMVVIKDEDAETDDDELEFRKSDLELAESVPIAENDKEVDEDSLNEKIDLKTGYYTGTNITPTKLQLDRLKKRGLVPQDYKLPTRVSKTNPSAKGFINFLNNLGKKVSDKGKELDPFYKEPKQNTKSDKKVVKQPDQKLVKKEPAKVSKKEVPPMDIMGAGTPRKDTKPNIDFEKIKKGIRAQKDSQKKTKTGGRTTYNTLARLSGIKNPDKISVGQTIKLPDGSTTKVRKGQTLSGIAQDYRMGKIGMKDTPPKAPKSGGPDKKFVTGPELDLPSKTSKVAKNNQINSPGALGGKVKPQIDKRLTPTVPLNQYAQKPDGTYTPKKDNSSIIGNPLSGLGKLVPDAVKNYKFGDMQRGFDKFFKNIKNDPIYKAAGERNKKLYGPKTDNKIANKESQQPTKTMIEQITGKKTCL